MLVVCLSGPASAVPLLQLDASDGVYSNGSVQATSDEFTLYALLTPNGQTTIADYSGDFYISMAILGSETDFGSFTFGGYLYGDGGLQLSPGGPSGLPTHGVFDTAWVESGSFTFSGSNTVGTYNTQDDPGGFGSFPGDGTYYEAFAVNTSELNPGIILHFDLYNYGGPEVDKFAPFSHDASSVPEPATMLLLGTGIFGLALFGRQRFKK